jgi:methionyl-tRNA formyltransferase|tara:strand:+ start:2240 stop:2911 length:672 start_codon:yes stop_codon:yes gene_type:complete
MTVLFFGRYKEKYSQKIFLLLKKYFRKVDVIWSKTYNEKITKKLKSQYDYIFTFRSYLILKNNTIKKAKIAAINFHPGPPKYRGVGCANYAIYEKSKFYGVTAHLIAPQIDSGKIIDITKFEISEKISLDILLSKTHLAQYYMAKKTIIGIAKNKDYLNNQVKNNIKNKWSKKIGNKNKLDKFYRLSRINLTNEELARYLRSTLYKNFKPYIRIKDKFFRYDN